VKKKKKEEEEEEKKKGKIVPKIPCDCKHPLNRPALYSMHDQSFTFEFFQVEAALRQLAIVEWLTVTQDETLKDAPDPSSMLTHLKLGGGNASLKPQLQASQVSAFMTPNDTLCSDGCGLQVEVRASCESM